MEKEVEHFSQKMLSVAEVVKEHRACVKCLEYWFANLESEMGKWKEHAKPVLDDLYLDSRRIRTDEHVLRVMSKVETGVENMFIPLLFVPGVTQRAAPYVHGGQTHNFRMPPVSHSVEERMVAGTLAMVETMVPCLDQFRDCVKGIVGSLDALIYTVEELHGLGDYKEEIIEEETVETLTAEQAKELGAEEGETRRVGSKRKVSKMPKLLELEKMVQAEGHEPAEGSAQGCWLNLWKFYKKCDGGPAGQEEMMPPEEAGEPPRHRRVLSALQFKQTHYHTVTNRCPRIMAKCEDIWNQYSLLLADVDEVPFDREKYADPWLEESVDPDGVCIKDHIYEATTNVEVILTVD